MVVVSLETVEPAEGVLYQGSNKLLVNDHELGTGTLYITENNIVFSGAVSASGEPVNTITILYPTVSMHAIQREPVSSFMLIINYDLRLPGMPTQGGGDGGEEVDEDDEYDPENEPVTHLKFLPQNQGENAVQCMYDAMTQGQTLHPDPDDEVNDEDSYMDGEDFNDDEEFEDAEESNPSEDAAARLRHMQLGNGNGRHSDDDGVEVGDH